ncbi:DUF3168 domain-containing protein [Paenibacillus aurantiacus]|uniref:DUF3168 domain-containing protein n=1 Tax=Paenibacillus aurantiacus TaxID=1936118 RepID=A0ABV5KXZ5_9BACL
MSFESALVEEFLALPDIGMKLFPLAAPEGTKAPYVVYGASPGLLVSTLSGYGSNKSLTVDINVVSSTYAGMKQHSEAVLALLIGFQARAIGEDGLFIQQLILEEPDEVYDDDTRLHKCVFSFTVHI